LKEWHQNRMTGCQGAGVGWTDECGAGLATQESAEDEVTGAGMPGEWWQKGGGSRR
jgi:hypothetical protein